MNRLLERLGGGAVRWRCAVIIAWLIILGGLLGAAARVRRRLRQQLHGLRDRLVAGLDLLNARSRNRAATPGRSCSTPSTARSPPAYGRGQPGNEQRRQAATRHQATSPFASQKSGQVVQGRHHRLRAARPGTSNPARWTPATCTSSTRRSHPPRKAGLHRRLRRRRRATSASRPSDQSLRDHRPDLRAALLLFMFGSLIAAAIPLLSAIFSVSPACRCSGCSPPRSRSRRPRRPSRRCSAWASPSTTGCS